MTEKWRKLIICFSIVVFLILLSMTVVVPQNNGDTTSASYNSSGADEKYTAVQSTESLENVNNIEIISYSDANSQPVLELDKENVETSINPIKPFSDTRNSRQTRVNHINTGSNDPNEGSTLFAIKESILVGSVKGSELHWFSTQQLKNPTKGKIYNFTVEPTSLTGFNNDDWLLVRIYVHWNFDKDWENKVDDPYTIDDNEMILLHQESYDWSVSTHTIGYAHASEKMDYYICIGGNPINPEDKLNYELTTNWFEINPPIDEFSGNENNYNIDKATPISPNTPKKNKFIDMDHQPMDWYSLSAPTVPPNTELLGINVTVSLDIESSSLPTTYTDPDNFVSFVMELNSVILHKTQSGEYIYGGVGNASKHAGTINKHSTVPINNDLRSFYNVHFYAPDGTANDKIVKSYIGIFAVTYGIDLKTDQHKFHDTDLDFRDEDTALNGWLEYSFNVTRSEPIVRPQITAKVYSLRTGTPYGTTYDKYRYHVYYTNPANYAPLRDQMKIYVPMGSNEPPITADLVQVDHGNTKYMYPPAEYIATIDGNPDNGLGEGDHIFQVICHDKHTYAAGSKCDKVIYDGPFISNNIPPTKIPTAVKNIIMNEDDPQKELNLDMIFEDVNGDPLHIFFPNEGGESQTKDTESVFLRIRNNKLGIEPIANKYGNNIIIIEASDLKLPMKNATHRLEITILPVNDPPTIKTPFFDVFFFGEIRFDEDTSFSNLNLKDIFWDPVENDPMMYYATGFENVKIDINETGHVTFIAKENWSGTEEITFYAIDMPGSILPSGIASDTLRVVVEPINDAPIINETNTIICYEETWCNITFEAYDPADQDPLEFYSDIAFEIGLNKEEFSFNEKTGELNFYPPNRVATGKTYSVLVTVRDNPKPEAGNPISVTTEVDFIIRNTWDKPSCEILEPNNGDRFLHIEPIDFRGICLDDDMKVPDIDEQITYQWYSNIDGKIGNRDIVRDVPLTAGDDGAEHIITLKVSDGKFYAYKSIRIYILKENQKRDTDKDGMPDYWEDINNLNKLDGNDALEDPDQDGFTNFEEWTYGLDGLEETTDPTDPWNPDSFPKDIPRDEKKDTEEDYFLPMALLSIIITVAVVVIITTYLLVSQRVVTARRYHERKTELENWAKKCEMEKQEAELKYSVYRTKKQNVLCHKCGHRNKIKSSKRPLAVRCTQCDTRGVIY